MLFAAFACVLPAHAQVTSEKDVIVLHALRQQRMAGDLWCAEVNVQINYQDISVRCDLVEIDRATGKLKAEGNVILDQGATRMSCQRLEFDLYTKTGTLWQVDAFFPPTYYFRGAELERLDETHYRLHDGLFTSCTLGSKAPPWSMQISDAIIELEGYGHFRGVSMRVKGVPVFYTPRFLWPIKQDRAFGLLPPRYGYNNRRGFFLGNSLYWPISRSFDTTSLFDYYSKGYYGLGQELRWAPAENSIGELAVGTVRDAESKKWEWKVQGKSSHIFPRGYTLKAELQELSDIDFYQRFERAFDRNSLRSLYSHITLSRVWGAQAFNVRTDHRRTFFATQTSGSEPAKSSAVVLDRLQEVEYRLRSTRIGKTPIYLSMVAIADHFRVSRPEKLDGRYGRLDVFPSVSILTPGLPWLNLTPTAGLRETYYTSQYTADRKGFEDEPLSRRYATAGLSVVGPSASRIWTFASGDKLKHLIEPRVEYSYVSDPGDASQIPVFDEKDSVIVTNRMRWTFANRLFYKTGSAGSREVASLEVTQEYSFSDPLILKRGDLPESRRGPLSVWLRTVPLVATNADARVDIDPVTKTVTSTAFSGGFQQGGKNLNLTWYSSYDPISTKVVSSQTRVSVGYSPPSSRWRAEAQLAYDIYKKYLMDERYIFRYRGSCWAVSAEIRDYRIKPNTDFEYRVSIDLTGLGTFLDIHGDID
jgi:lipopolysaccharide assembly outer membrane protein LptD (OstA)